MFRFIATTLLIGACLTSLGKSTFAQTDQSPTVLAPPSVLMSAGRLADIQLTTPALPAIPALPVIPSAPSPVPATKPVEAKTATPIATTVADENSTVLAGASVPLVPMPKWYNLAYWFGPTPWDLGFELGINGAKGTNESLSLRTGGHAKRETDFWKFDTTLVYNKNTANGLETQNNSLLDVRIDRKLGESPWSLFFMNQELYDEFQAYDLRVSLNSGVGYQFIDTKHLDLIGRFGAGASHEFGGPDDRWAYEALFGMEYDHELSKTQRLSAKVDYFPEWENFDFYRVVTDVGWEIDLDRPGNMSLKFAVIDRYDSTPNGADPNEINYSVLLIWGI